MDSLFREVMGTLSEQRDLFSNSCFSDTVYVTLFPTIVETLTTPVLAILTFYRFRVASLTCGWLVTIPLPEGRPGMSDVSPLSGISGLSFDTTLLSPLLFFCLVLLPFLFYRFLPAGPFF